MAFAGKVALITGGTKGIGKSTATILVSQGAKVLVNYGGDKASADATVQELGAANCVALQADAGTLAGVQAMVTTAVDKFGKIDILVPNAGWLPMKGVADVTEADFDRAFALNVKGPMFLVQTALPHMTAGGRIVMISTTQNYASTVSAAYMLYNATKGAVDQMVRCLAKELGGRDINVNAVAPGPTGTDLFYQGKSEQVVKQIASLNPHNRVGKPDELGAAIAWLCSEASSWISGQTIRVNGGMA